MYNSISIKYPNGREVLIESKPNVLVTCMFNGADVQYTEYITNPNFSPTWNMVNSHNKLEDIKMSGLSTSPYQGITTFGSPLKYNSESFKTTEVSYSIFEMCRRGDLNAVKRACESLPGAHKAFLDGGVNHAASYGQLDILKYAVEGGMTLTSSKVENFFICCAGGDHLDIIQYMERWINPKYIDYNSCFHTALHKSSIKIIEYIIKNKRIDGITSNHLLIMFREGNAQVFKLFLKYFPSIVNYSSIAEFNNEVVEIVKLLKPSHFDLIVEMVHAGYDLSGLNFQSFEDSQIEFLKRLIKLKNIS